MAHSRFLWWWSQVKWVNSLGICSSVWTYILSGISATSQKKRPQILKWNFHKLNLVYTTTFIQDLKKKLKGSKNQRYVLHITEVAGLVHRWFSLWYSEESWSKHGKAGNSISRRVWNLVGKHTKKIKISTDGLSYLGGVGKEWCIIFKDVFCVKKTLS